MDLWRISKYPSITGEGGRLYAARWHSAGAPVVYLAESPPGALIEILVHLEIKSTTAPPAYTLLRVSVPGRLKIVTLAPPEDAVWQANEASTRAIGDTWLKARKSALARVPSAILPHTFNYLLNPLHPDAPRITITETTAALLDHRLIP